MRASSLSAVVLLLTWPFALLAQQSGHNAYTPPPTLESLMQDDPTFMGAKLWVLASDPEKFRATVEKQAASGKLVAQMMLGMAYLPPECTFLPFKTAPADCPDDPLPNNPMRVTRSFELAIHWLSLASEQGNGEASEILAQVIERTIKSPNSSHYAMADVARYHALARSQGFDLQDVELSCYSLDPNGPADRLIMADIPAEYQFTPGQLVSLHTAGASGTLRWGSSGIQPGLNVVLRHPQGPKVHTRVILAGSPTREVLVSLADRADVVYLQQGDQVVTIPSAYPALRRMIAFRPSSADQEAGAKFQTIDGQFAGGCISRTFPTQSTSLKP